MLLLQIEFTDRHGEFEDENQCVTIDLETLEISGNEHEDGVWAKVTDTGIYTLIDGNKEIQIIDNYVPDCIPNEYGDYLDLEVQDDKVVNWHFQLEDIEDEFKAKGKIFWN